MIPVTITVLIVVGLLFLEQILFNSLEKMRTQLYEHEFRCLMIEKLPTEDICNQVNSVLGKMKFN